MKCLFLILIFSLFCFSCDGIITQKKSSEEFLKEELKTISWNEVDTYPLFQNCDESKPKEIQKKCFETVLETHFKKVIQNYPLHTPSPIIDTFSIHLQISNKGEILITNILCDSLTFKTFPELKKSLKESIHKLPTIHPALKRGVPVNTTLVQPLIINAQ